MNNNEQEIEKYRMLGSLLEFTKIFFKLRTGRMFEITHPQGRESHIYTVCREMVSVFRGDTQKLMINIPPRYAKTELLIHFIAWGIANYPDSNNMYISYSHSLAKKQTQTIKQIIQLSHFRKFFGVEIKDDVSAKDNFELTQGGSVYAAGAGGTITGRGAGIKNVDRFGGVFAIDDIHKPDEVNSDTMREAVIDWYYNTAQSRMNSPKTPQIFIGQRVHEDDLAARLIKSGEWKVVSIPALDANNNPLAPEYHNRQALLKMKETMPYVFAAQYQQDPQPAGGGIFKEEWWKFLDDEPDILFTFITVDTAETDKDYNDATAFSFFGIYKIVNSYVQTDTYGLHWIDCSEVRVEPKDLESEFNSFYSDCMRHKVKPYTVVIEKKSTGATLASVLKSFQGLTVMPVERTKSSGNKTSRFLEIQPYISSGYVSLPRYGKHTDLCVKHCSKITANNSHRFDDICDTLYDGVKLALIDRLLINKISNNANKSTLARKMMSNFNNVQKLKEIRNYGTSSL